MDLVMWAGCEETLAASAVEWADVCKGCEVSGLPAEARQ